MTLCNRLPVFAALALALGAPFCAQAQRSSQPLLKRTIDESKSVVVAGNTRPSATAENDRGALPDTTPVTGLHLLLKRPAAAEAAFDAYLNGLNDPKSANYHQWLTNAQIGTMFGASQQDVQTITDWLGSHGFTVNGVAPDETVIEFSGTAGMVRSTFKAELHRLDVDGEEHFGNVKDPELPADLTVLVKGVAKLNNFQPHPMHHMKAARPAGIAVFSGTVYDYVGAADLATIYNFNPLFKAGTSGKGQTIVVVEDTKLYSGTSDWSVFRKAMGLSRAYPYGSLTEQSPTGSNTCTAPTVNADDGEAAIDVDWASAAAPNAAIISAECADTTQFGGFLALSNLLQQANPPKIVSISYGESEAQNGATENAYINALYKSAAAEGVSVFVSSGDEGAASADANKTYATHGIAVSGFTSTPYNISVGGTDFAAAAFNEESTYFNSTNGTNFQTAKSYIPEIPWNDSCAGFVLYTILGFPNGSAACNNATVKADGYLTTASGSGGPSGCATGAPAVSGVVSGTCAGYAKPSWQSLLGVPSDGVRDIPDVSLFAANGVFGSYYAFCLSDPGNGNAEVPCDSNPADWAGAGGTSISSPIWAGIQALVNQTTGTSWGNSNPVLYSLAANEYGTTGSPACHSTLGNGTASSCVFYDVTLGDMDVPCAKRNGVAYNCYIPAGSTYGVLSTSNTAPVPAYAAGVGYDLATGIGTTNATNLVAAWAQYATAAAAPKVQ